MRDIVFVTVDSLRADHVGWHGYERETTPNLDDRAASAHRFSNAFAHACSTRPSFPSILTSSYALMYGGYERLSPQRTTVAEALSRAGYQTAGFHSNLYLSADFGYGRGFDHFFDSRTEPSTTAKVRQFVKRNLDDDGAVYSVLQSLFNKTEKRAGIELGSAYVRADELTDKAIDWAREAGDGAPRFLWVHYMDVHHPYVPPAEYQRRFRGDPVSDRDAVKLRRKMLERPDEVTEEELETIVDLYDAEIAFVDDEIERLLTALEGEWGDDVTVAFTADHGEEFLDHGGFSHSATFYDEVIHVPLFFDAGDGGGSYDELVGLQDVPATFVARTDVDRPDSFHGHDLATLYGDGEWERSSVISEWSDLDTGDRRFSIRTSDRKYVRMEDGEERLHDLRNDPDETENLIDEGGETAARLRERIDRHEAAVDETDEDVGDVEMDEDVKQRLRDLGYQE